MKLSNSNPMNSQWVWRDYSPCFSISVVELRSKLISMLSHWSKFQSIFHGVPRSRLKSNSSMLHLPRRYPRRHRWIARNYWRKSPPEKNPGPHGVTLTTALAVASGGMLSLIIRMINSKEQFNLRILVASRSIDLFSSCGPLSPAIHRCRRYWSR